MKPPRRFLVGQQDPAGEQRIRQAANILAAIIVCANVILVSTAVSQGSWAAFYLGLMGAPLSNACLFIAGLLYGPVLKRASKGASMSRYWMVSVFLPLAAAVADFLIILVALD